MGVRADQIPLYKKEMYIAERESYLEVPTVHDKIYKVKTAVTGAGDKENQILGAGPLDRHVVEGQDVSFGSPKNGWEYLVKYWTYSSGITLTMEAVEDTVKLGNLLKELASTWGKQNRIAEEELGARAFNEGGTTAGDWVFNGTHTGQTDSSGAVLYDSISFFNVTGSTRATKGGGTYFNSVAATGDVSTDNFETIYTLHTETNAYDERDDIIENPADTILCKSATDKWKWERILKTPPSQGIPNSVSNDINPYFNEIPNIIKWRYLTDSADVFYMLKAQSRMAQFHKRKRPVLRFFRDENNLGYKVSNHLRMGLLFRDFRWCTRGGGTVT